MKKFQEKFSNQLDISENKILEEQKKNIEFNKTIVQKRLIHAHDRVIKKCEEIKKILNHDSRLNISITK